MAHGVHRVASQDARRADRRASRRIYLYSALAAGVVTLLLYFL